MNTSHETAPGAQATLVIDGDGNNNGMADPQEELSFSGSNWTGDGVEQFYQMEYSDTSGTSLLQTVTISPKNYQVTFSSGNLEGVYITTTSFAAGARSIRIRIIDNKGTEGTSGAMPVKEKIAPQIVEALALDLSTIRVTFDEPVEEVNGDAAARFLLAGDDAIYVEPLSLSPLGTPPATGWTLNLDGTLGDRDPDGGINPLTVTYDTTTNSLSPQLQDISGNQVKNQSSQPVTDGIAPAIPTLVTPIDSANFEGGTVNWSATGDDATNDPSIAYLQLQGSIDSVGWVSVGNQDNSVNSTSYSGSYTVTTQYAYYRITAVDDEGNESYSGSTIDYQGSHHIHIVSPPVFQPLNTFEDPITLEIHDAYGNTESVTETVNLSMKSGSGIGTFRLTPTGPDITFIQLTNQSTASFYFACTQTGTKSIDLSAAALFDAAQQATITADTATGILIRLPGQSFVNGSGITGTPQLQTAGTSFIMNIYIVDSGSNLVENEDGSRNIDFSSNAVSGPLGDAPTLNGVSPDNGTSSIWTDLPVQFTDGASENITAILYNTQNAVNFLAEDSTGVPNLSGNKSSDVSVNPAVLDYFGFNLNTAITDALPLTGTNTLSAYDPYGNIKTDYHTTGDTVALEKNSGPGNLTVTGLSGPAGNELYAGDFVDGVADLTALSPGLDVSQEGIYQIKAIENGVNRGVSSDLNIQYREVAVGHANTAQNGIIDASPSNSDLSTSVDLTGDELTGYNYSDDFQIKWGFGTDATGSNLQLADSSGDLTVAGGGLAYTIAANQLQAGSTYSYFFWWVENLSSAGNQTILTGVPIATDKRRLVVNPTLQTAPGDNGSDVSGGGFTPGVSDQEVLSVKFTPSPPEATIVVISLSFAKSGTAGAADIDNFNLYHDRGTIGVRDGADLLLGTVPYPGGSEVAFTSLSLDVTASSTHVLVTIDVNDNASPTATLGLNLPDENSIGVGDNVLNGDASAIGKSPFSGIGTQGDHSLPVSLVSFLANADYEKIVLKWETASEVNNEGFYLYRSEANKQNYIRLNQQIIQGQGTSNSARQYEYTDHDVETDKTYNYKLISRDFDGTLHNNGMVSATVIYKPEKFSLYQNYPNPFNPSTQIKFEVAEESRINLTIYNMLGQRVRTLIDNQILQPGLYENVVWNARDGQGNPVANGIYYMVITAREHRFKSVRKIIYMK